MAGVLHIYLNFELWNLTFMFNIKGITSIDSQKDSDYDIGKVLSSFRGGQDDFLTEGRNR